jgi:hypothetical protein
MLAEVPVQRQHGWLAWLTLSRLSCFLIAPNIQTATAVGTKKYDITLCRCSRFSKLHVKKGHKFIPNRNKLNILKINTSLK